MMEGQDWNPVVLRKKKPSSSESKSNVVVNEVRFVREGWLVFWT